MSIVTSLWGYCSPHITNFLNLKTNLNSLRSTLGQLECKRDDVMHKIRLAQSDLAEPRESTNEVKNWLERVEAIKKEVDEILEQRIITQILILRNSVIEKLTTVRELIREGEFRVVAERRLQQQIQEIPTPAGVVGMEPKLEELLKFVNEDDQVKSLRILGIYGMGGVGKTTLLKKLHNELSKRNHGFDLAIWVVVSKDMNLQNVQKKIAKSLNLTLSDESDLVTTAREIFTVLKTKKFVLLLDDIWERIDLQSIGVPPCDSTTHETNKSIVVFTTRSEGVCGQMEAHREIQVDCLKSSEAWSLFQEEVGNEVINGHPQIPELAKVVANKCQGLPLALINIGRSMASKKTIHEWRHAVNVLHKSASEFPGMDDQVLQILKFSYDNLENEKIKSCFLYCSLFPEDHHINTEELIDNWIVEGFIDNFENMDEAHYQGQDIIEKLRSVSLLETYGNPTIKSVKMHVVVRDLAIWIASNYRSTIWTTSDQVTIGEN